MNQHNLSIYLNDHLAGSTAALELLELLETTSGLERFAGRMRREISEDREELLTLMKRLSITASTTRRVAAWIIEKAAELKMGLEERGGGALKRFELLEALALGVDGKLALWCALQAASSTYPELKGLDYPRLKLRAAGQRHEIERQRVAAGVEAMGSDPAVG